MAEPVPLTYGSYLRIPELLDLQTPLAVPLVPDEMLFIIGQQAQELWFKQILLDLQGVITLLQHNALLEASRLLDRVNRILKLLAAEAELLETLPPVQFAEMRGALQSASGLESQQFRELELASGLRDVSYLRMVERIVDVPEILARWPVSLHDALVATLPNEGADPTDALHELYRNPAANIVLYDLAEAFSEYELRFREWRFQHMQLVERIIGGRSAGTGGSAGSTYLGHTLQYRFFPELWAARDRLTTQSRTIGQPV